MLTILWVMSLYRGSKRWRFNVSPGNMGMLSVTGHTRPNNRRTTRRQKQRERQRGGCGKLWIPKWYRFGIEYCDRTVMRNAQKWGPAQKQTTHETRHCSRLQEDTTSSDTFVLFCRNNGKLPVRHKRVQGRQSEQQKLQGGILHRACS